MARDSRGRFLKGEDPDRHIFTIQECKEGRQALIRKMPAKSWSLSRSQAHRVAEKTNCLRLGLPAPEYPKKTVFESAADRKGKYTREGKKISK